MPCVIYALQAVDRLGAGRGLPAADARPADRDVLRGDRAAERAATRWSTWLLAVLSVPLVLPVHPHPADVMYEVAHFATVVHWCGRRAPCWSGCPPRASPIAGACSCEASTDALTGLHNRREFESGRCARWSARDACGAAVAGDHRHRFLQAHQRPARPRRRRRRAAPGRADAPRRTSARATCWRASAARSSRSSCWARSPPARGWCSSACAWPSPRCACPAGTQEIGCTISIGMTDRVDWDVDWPMLYKRADLALYAGQGRRPQSRGRGGHARPGAPGRARARVTGVTRVPLARTRGHGSLAPGRPGALLLVDRVDPAVPFQYAAQHGALF